MGAPKDPPYGSVRRKLMRELAAGWDCDSLRDVIKIMKRELRDRKRNAYKNN